MLRFLVDEDMPNATTAVFERHGHRVDSVRSLGMRGATDAEIVDHAYRTGAIVVTRDTDFGDIIRYPEDTHPGAVILRLPHTYTTDQITDRLDEFLSTVSDDELEHAIVVLELGRYRIRDL